jgi:raffinose/stachyose/melibiose transport system permease protein
MATTLPAQRSGAARSILHDDDKRRWFRPGLVLLYGLLIFWAAVQLFPILFMFLQSVKTDAEIMGNIWALPEVVRLENFGRVWEGGQAGVPIGRYFGNSLIVTAGTLLLLTTTGALAGYALARFDFPGQAFFRSSMIWALAIPIHALMIPVFHFTGRLGMRNNLLGLILVYTAFWLPFTILLMRSYFLSFPRELEEAAKIDGATTLGTFFRIVLPISRGAMAGISIVNVVGIWSELLFAFLLMNKQPMRTLPVGMLSFQGQYSVEWSTVFAAFTMAALPTLIFFLIFQQQITKGMTVGAVK